MKSGMKRLFFLALGAALLLAGAAFYIENATLVTDIGIREETVCDLSDLTPETELTVHVRFFCDPESKIKPMTLLRTDGGFWVRLNEKKALEIGRGKSLFVRNSVPSETGVRRFTLHYVGGKLEFFQNYVSPLRQMLEHPFASGPAPGLFPHKLWVNPSPDVQIRQLTIRTGNWENTIFFLKAFAVFWGITAAGCGAAALAGGNAVLRNTEPDIVCTAAIAAFWGTALFLLIAAAVCFPEARMPDSSGLLVSSAEICPEPKEQLLYLLALLCGGTISLLSAFYAVRAPQKTSFPGAQNFAFTVLLIFCLSGIFLHFCQFPGAPYGLVCALGMAALLTFRQNAKAEKAAAIFCGVTGLCFLSVWAIRFFQMPCTISFLHHYCAVVHSLYMAAYGYIPFADFQSQYGLYSLFLAPLFRVLPLNFFTINTVFLLLALIVAGAFFRLLQRCCCDRLMPYLGSAAILAMYTGTIYLQQFPLRTFFPALMLLFVRHESEKPSAKMACLGTAFCALSLLWSPDTGAVLLVAHTFFLGYLVWEKYRDKSFCRKGTVLLAGMTSHCLLFAVVLLAALGICKLLSGKMPDLRMLFQYSMIFGKTGFFSLPMPAFGAWLLPAAVYCTGLCFAFFRLFSGEGKEPWKGRFVFFCSLLGCGIASYYVGRSHDDNVPAILYPALVLLTVFADSMTGRRRNWRMLLLAVLLFPLFRLWILLPQQRFTEQEKGQMLTVDRICGTFAGQLGNGKQKLLLQIPLGTYYAIRLGAEPLCGYTCFEEGLFLQEAERTLNRLLHDRSLAGIGLIACSKYGVCTTTRHLKDYISSRTGQKLPENAMLYLTLPLEIPVQNQKENAVRNGTP